MQVPHQTQRNSNFKSIKRNTCLNFCQFENEILEITAQLYTRKGSIQGITAKSTKFNVESIHE